MYGCKKSHGKAPERDWQSLEFLAYISIILSVQSLKSIHM